VFRDDAVDHAGLINEIILVIESQRKIWNGMCNISAMVNNLVITLHITFNDLLNVVCNISVRFDNLTITLHITFNDLLNNDQRKNSRFKIYATKIII